MKRLLALLLLAVMSPAFSQQPPQYDYTVTNPTYTGLEGINQTQGVPTNLGDDGTVSGISIGFDFDFYGETFNTVNLSSNGLISFKNNINGCCSGELLPSNQYNDFGIFGIWTDLVNIGTSNPYYKTFGEEGDRRFVVGWYDQAMYYDANQRSSFEITLFEGSNNILLEYADVNLNRTFTAGIQGYGSQGQYEQIYFGADGNTLDNTSWLLTYSAVEPPPPPEEPEQPIAPDCTINPNDPTCIINALIPDTTDEEFLADTGFDDGSDDGSEPVVEEDPVQEEMFADMDSMQEESFDDEPIDEQPLEEMLADSSSEEDFDEELVTAIEPLSKELADEEKAGTLADSIGKDVLEAALSIAADATVSGSVGGSESQSSSSSSSSSSRSTNEMVAGETATSESQVASVSEQSENQMMESQQDAALDILETGRAMGQEALAATMSLTESSAVESLAEAESVASASVSETESSIQSVAAEIESSSTTLVADSSSTEALEDSQQQSMQQMQDNNDDVAATEVLVSDTTQQDTQTQEDQSSMEQNPEQMVVQFEVEQQTDNSVVAQEEVQSAVEFTDMSSVMENFMVTNDSQTAEQEELENSIIQQAIASSQQNEDDNKMGFAEAEAMTIASDPALANAFNVQPNTASLELLGVLGSRAEEKSDAELRAEQVVAANKEQQDAINANYMDADQSGIVSAIAVDADVSSYLTQRIPDVPFYMPEDIYKGVIIKDNVRGSYFLEKGNTDTYKKMVEEQYK